MLGAIPFSCACDALCAITASAAGPSCGSCCTPLTTPGTERFCATVVLSAGLEVQSLRRGTPSLAVPKKQARLTSSRRWRTSQRACARAGDLPPCAMHAIVKKGMKDSLMARGAGDSCPEKAVSPALVFSCPHSITEGTISAPPFKTTTLKRPSGPLRLSNTRRTSLAVQEMVRVRLLLTALQCSQPYWCRYARSVAPRLLRTTQISSCIV